MIPWLPTIPLRPVVPLAPPCRVTQLRVAPQVPRLGVFFGGETGSLAGWIIFRNTGRPCSLVGRPHIELLSRGNPLPRQTEAPEAEGTAPDVLPPPFSTRALPRGRSAQVATVWSEGCRSADAVRVTLPDGGGSAVLPQRLRARCDQPGAHAVISVATFQSLVPPPAPSTHLPLRISFTRRFYRAVPGTTLHYTITLRNTSTRPFRFGRRCPIYLESLGNANETYVLNCRPVKTIRPRASVTFAMELRVPVTLRRGTALAVELGLGTYLPQDWSAPATVAH